MLPPEAQSIFDRDTTAAFFSGPDGVIRHWSPGAQQLLGYAATEIEGRRVDVLIPPQYHDAHWAGYDRAIATGRFQDPGGATLPVVAKGGEPVSLAFFGRIVRDGTGAVAGIVSSLTTPWDPAVGPFYELSGAPLHGVDLEQVVSTDPGIPTFHVRRGFVYLDAARDDRVEVPEGTETDLASVPPLFWWLFASYGRHTAAAIVHDVLIDDDDPARGTLEARREADALFFRALEASGSSWFRHRLAFVGVVVGGTMRKKCKLLMGLFFAHAVAFWVAVGATLWSSHRVSAAVAAAALALAGLGWGFSRAAARPYSWWMWFVGAGALLLIALPVAAITYVIEVVLSVDRAVALVKYLRSGDWVPPNANPTDFAGGPG